MCDLCDLGGYNSISQARLGFFSVFRLLLSVLWGRIFRLGRLCSFKLLGIRSFYNDEILCGCALIWAEFCSCFLFHAQTPNNRSPLFCLNDELVVSRGNLFSGSTFTETLTLCARPETITLSNLCRMSFFSPHSPSCTEAFSAAFKQKHICLHSINARGPFLQEQRQVSDESSLIFCLNKLAIIHYHSEDTQLQDVN